MELLIAIGRHRSGSCHTPFPLKRQNVSETSHWWDGTGFINSDKAGVDNGEGRLGENVKQVGGNTIRPRGLLTGGPRKGMQLGLGGGGVVGAFNPYEVRRNVLGCLTTDDQSTTFVLEAWAGGRAALTECMASSMWRTREL